uniref:CRAL-TRIO domain-containing protein n=1 Tax=Spongospora subterranea TaxID=70186 RepID=A0A0H5QGK1_9EUKA|eukprot:CRZ00727.1 hypothetical protein [Spongospora subterranea]
MSFSQLLFSAAVVSLLTIAHSDPTHRGSNPVRVSSGTELPQYMSGLDQCDKLIQVIKVLRSIEDDDKNISELVKKFEKHLPKDREIGKIRVELDDLIDNPLVVYRFLMGNEFKFDETVKALRSSLAWRTAWNYHQIVDEVNKIVKAHPVAPYEYFPFAGKVLPVLPQIPVFEHLGNGGNLVSFIGCSKDYQPHHVLDRKQLIVFQIYMLAYQCRHVDATHIELRSTPNPGADSSSILKLVRVIDPSNFGLNSRFLFLVQKIASDNFMEYVANIVADPHTWTLRACLELARKFISDERIMNKLETPKPKQLPAEFWPQWIGKANYENIFATEL